MGGADKRPRRHREGEGRCHVSAPYTLKPEDWRCYRHVITDAPLPGKSEVVDNIGWNREPLMDWAAWCGRRGEYHRAIRDEKADTGTLAHLFIEQTLRGQEVRAPEGVPPEMFERALVALAAWQAWWDFFRVAHTVEVLAIELPLVDSEMGFGTTIDVILRVDGAVVVVDWKTGSLHDEHIIGLAAQRRAWNVHSAAKCFEGLIIRCPGDGSPAAEVRIPSALLDKGAMAFAAALALHQLRNDIVMPAPTPEEGF